MPAQDTYQVANLRLHKVIGVYLALLGWKKQADVVVLARDSLLSALDLKALHDRRIRLFCAQNKSLFPYYRHMVTGPGAKITSVVLSRLRLPEPFPTYSAAPAQIVAALKEHRIRAIQAALPTERQIVKLLALLSHGLADFSPPRPA